MEPDLKSIPWARRLKLRHLETFLVLESAGSITAAAERMHMTQPAVSHWLADIEDVMGSRPPATSCAATPNGCWGTCSASTKN
jgi:hypothetical protein